MKEHNLKLETQYFDAAISGKKNFEVRFDDRQFRAGDTVVLREWDSEKQDYTGMAKCLISNLMILPNIGNAVGINMAGNVKRLGFCGVYAQSFFHAIEPNQCYSQ